jgi:hypothetical protein
MLIHSSFRLPFENETGCHLFLESMGMLIERIIPPDVLLLRDNPKEFARALTPHLPLVDWSPPREGSHTFGIALISNAEFSHGTGRFVSDALSRHLIRGKLVEIGGTRTLSFHFFPDEPQEYLINERWIVADTPETVELIRKNLPGLVQELRLTLLSISKARRFLSLRPPLSELQTTVAQEFQHLSSFEEMHQAIRRLSAETTLSAIRERIAPIYQKRPKVFDRDMFDEIKPFVTLYNEAFMGIRRVEFIARLICIHVYFKKLLKERTLKEPLSRHVLLKIFRDQETVRLIVALNLFGNNEVLKKHHVIEAINNTIGGLTEVPDSFFMDTTTEHQPVLYLELQKKNRLPFTPLEFAMLRSKLPTELRQSVQSILNPLFMLRNDEDHLRDIITLSRELRFVADIPQVVISFEEQTVSELAFSVVLARVVKPDSPPMKEMLAALPLRSHLRELKNIGSIRNKHPKEAAIFKISLPKHPYLRRDWSLDLPQARQSILAALNHVFREVRDYNGGLISNQLETLKQLKALLGPIGEEHGFALESFFFSLEPLIAQTTTSPALLKEGFLLLLDLIEAKSPYKITSLKDGVCAAFILSSPQLKENLIALLETSRTSFTELAYSMTHIQELLCITVFLPCRELSKQGEFEDLLTCFSESMVAT